ncbi:putative Ig domain-containing protein [Curtobacterium flaccumfaciens]|uniref:putative Ig domain-containing protein n=1 Tax=Curtobacterium flaccumfaciens TaxID=2035 RepID=UPI00188BF43C|nr:putative Ig domain-containing protein [Curtobacterium flaccumfaciens]MBF4593705.1 putative Ig domain-containing protein [Curtobacterium flaccumfaciens]MBF4627623.1 putative Ig domain-containing protein [Curtobacterium flaccumfaciens]
MHRSTSTVRRACAVGTTVALVGLTTGLGIMTATAANAETLDTTQPIVAAETLAPTPVVSDETPTPTDPPVETAPETPAPVEEAPAPTPEATEPAAPETTVPAATEAPKPTETPKPDVTAKAADATVTIEGTAKVGTRLVAVVTGFDDEAGYKYSWTDQDGNVLSKAASYVVDPTDVRKTITVAVTGTLPGATETSTVESEATAAVTQTPAFLGEDGQPTKAGATQDSPLELSTAAGDAFSHTFRAQGFPEPKYSLAWFDDEELEDTTYFDENGDEYIPEPDEQLPYGISFDASTGELSGIATDAWEYTFAVTATSGTESVTQYVSLNVEAGAPLGVQVYTIDRAQLTADKQRTWIIAPDGSVYTVDSESTDDSFSVELTEGGRPTVKQGGTLVVQGGLVDRFGNDVLADEDEVVLPTVTSDIASDVIAPDPELGDFGVVGVTFPHASVHNLSVAFGSFSTSFAVEVQPTVTGIVAPVPAPPAAAAPVAPVNTGGQLAYTGSDTTDALPWALGLLVAGAGLIGARFARRRRAQR